MAPVQAATPAFRTSAALLQSPRIPSVRAIRFPCEAKCSISSITVCPNGNQAAGGCVNGQCGAGYTCQNGLCCLGTSGSAVRCLDGSEAVGACIPSCQGGACGSVQISYYCGSGYTCTTGNICCPVTSEWLHLISAFRRDFSEHTITFRLSTGRRADRATSQRPVPRRIHLARKSLLQQCCDDVS